MDVNPCDQGSAMKRSDVLAAVGYIFAIGAAREASPVPRRVDGGASCCNSSLQSVTTPNNFAGPSDGSSQAGKRTAVFS